MFKFLIISLNHMKLWEILIPKYSNEKELFSETHHDKWRLRVLEMTSGLTQLDQVKGYWVHNKKTYIEDMIPIRVICNDTNVEKIIEETITHYDQKAVLAYVISSEVKLEYDCD